jgi:hypothetical protein
LDAFLTNSNDIYNYQPEFLGKFNFEEFTSENYSITKAIKEFFIKKEISSIEEAKVEFIKFITEGICGIDKYGEYRCFKEVETSGDYENYQGFLNDLDLLSVGLYRAYPEFFFPYFYRFHFIFLEKISIEFNITIPELKQKSNYYERLMHYFTINNLLYEFGKINDLDCYELNAFLYSFSINFIENDDFKDDQEPRNVWISCTNGSSNKNISTSHYLKNKKIELSSNYYEHKPKPSTKSDISADKSLFFVYNPSIQWNKDGNITTIARVSGNVTIPRIKNCIHNHFKNTKPGIIRGFSNYFNIFGKKKEGASGIVIVARIDRQCCTQQRIERASEKPRNLAI